MSLTLSHLSTSLSHIHEQFQSSHESVLFIHGLLSAFQSDLASTTLARQIELKTMTTVAGIQLRKIIIGLHNNLARELGNKIKLYGCIAQQLRIKAHQLKQGVKQAIHQNKNLQQNDNFIKTKTTRIDDQVNRLAKISQTIQRDRYFKNLKQMFCFQKDNQYVSVGLPHEKIKQINNKLEGYINQHKNIVNFAQINYSKTQTIVNELIKKLNKIENNAGNFLKIYQLIYHSTSPFHLRDNATVNKYTYANNQQKQKSNEQRSNQINGSPHSKSSNRNTLNCRQVLSAGSNRISQVSRQMSTAMKNFNLMEEDLPNSHASR